MTPLGTEGSRSIGELITRRESEDNHLAFYSLLLFTFVVYIVPQSDFPALRALSLAKTSAVLCIAAYVWNALRKGKRLIQVDRPTALLLLLVGFALLSIPFSEWRRGSLDTFVELYAKSIIVFLVIANMIESEKRLEKMLAFTIACCCLLAVAGIRHFIAGEYYGGGRIEGVGWGIASNPNDLALTLNLALPFAIGVLRVSERKLIKILCLSYIVLGVAAVICTFSRGGAIVLSVMYLMYIQKNYRKKRLKLLVPFGLLLICFLWFGPDGYMKRMSTIFDFSEDTSGSAESREKGSLAAIAVMLEQPITGVGLGMNVLALNKKGFLWEETHNVYLELGSEIGVPGMITFVLLLLKLIKDVRKVQKSYADGKDVPQVAVLAEASEISLVGFAMAGFFHPVAYHFYFYYIAGFAVSITRIHENERVVLAGNGNV
jgi:putative inorganic carbon (HCO3(-)) transporter